MDIVIPTSLTEYELYSTAKRVIEEYQLDETNLYEFPIRVFNKLAYSLGLDVNQEFKEGLDRVFTQKGSYKSVISLLNLIGVDALVDVNQTPLQIRINVDMSLVRNINFLQYLSDCISYLIFFDELMIAIETLIFQVPLGKPGDLNVLSINLQFNDHDIHETELKRDILVKDSIDVSCIGVNILFSDIEKSEKLIKELELKEEKSFIPIYGLNVTFGGIQPIPNVISSHVRLIPASKGPLNMYGMNIIFSDVKGIPNVISKDVRLVPNSIGILDAYGMNVTFGEIILNK